jgi:hypothetical protein
MSHSGNSSPDGLEASLEVSALLDRTCASLVPIRYRDCGITLATAVAMARVNNAFPLQT